MKASLDHFFKQPQSRVWIAGAGGAAAGTACIWLADAPWWVAPATCAASTLMQWLELRWTTHRMRMLLKTRRRARMAAQLKGQA